MTAKFLIPSLVGLLISLGGWTYAGLNARVEKLEDGEPNKAAAVAILDVEVRELHKQLDRLEQKLDYLIRVETDAHAR